MRISAINNYTYQAKSNMNFKGILIEKSSHSDSWDYEGNPSSSCIDGHYMGSNDVEDYIYYPFKDEPKHIIEKNIKDNNYTWDYATMGLGGGLTVSTELGKTLPYTEKEWNKMSKEDQEKIKSLLI